MQDQVLEQLLKQILALPLPERLEFVAGLLRGGTREKGKLRLCLRLLEDASSKLALLIPKEDRRA